MAYPRILATAAAIPASLMVCTESVAQDLPVTISSEAKPVFMGGELAGCALNFEVGRYDPEFSEGKLVYITGSLNFYSYPDRSPFFVLKLGVKGSEDASEFVPPVDAYLVSDFATNKEDFSNFMESDTLGFRLFAFKAGEATLDAVIAKVSQSRTLTFAYSLRSGGMNAIVPVDLRMKQLNFDAPQDSILDERTPEKWLDCLGEASKKALEGTQSP